MSDWHSFPERSWSRVGRLLSGYGGGSGPYRTAYSLRDDGGPLLNGRILAKVLFPQQPSLSGVGVLCRADRFSSFVAFYLVTDASQRERLSVRLAAFKEGTIRSIVALQEPIPWPRGPFHLSLQFFSGKMIGEVVSGETSHRISYLIPEVPFPGHCGLVRFYGAPATVLDVQIEEITMKPKLQPIEEAIEPFEYTVFLSHSHADLEHVKRLAAAFRKEGIKYWVDHEQINFGDPIVQKIEEGLAKSRYVVVCLSESLNRSTWVRAEYGPILYREFSGDTARRVIPLSIDGSSSASVPLLLADKLRADFTDPSSFEAFLRFLREARAPAMSPKEPPPP
jgi:hypothetical protein